ncbi:MAG TPA: tyrosinase family protein [Chthoniobacterales bacterium]
MTASPGAPHNRRKFLQIAGTAAGALYLPPFARAQNPTVLARKDLATLTASDPTLTILKQGIAAMQARPTTDGWNWSNVASMHQNFCAHNNWYFFPWHRPYVGFLEYVIQNVTNTPSFRMPYWNWTRNNKIPAQFTSAPLYDPSRQVSPTTPIPSGYCDSTTMSRVIGTADFQSYASMKGTDQWASVGAGAFEGTPHNCVHWWMGGDMGTFMSPLDPLFWMHHSNVDRLWAVWNTKHANTTDPAWLNYQLQYGAFPNWPVTSTLSTQAMGYTYDRLTSV